tara:strand:+ start:184 stop:2289 length:2106 start_codon:yes stop_codon:yes gene_type:complete
MTSLERYKGINLLDPFLQDRTRWFLWSPALIGAGIAIYFSLQDEPSLYWIALPLLFSFLIYFLRNTDKTFVSVCILSLFLVSLGFAASVLRSHMVAAPILQKQQMTELEGTILEKSTGYKSARFVIGELTFRRSDGMPELAHIRLTSRINFADVRPGQRIAVRAILLPPPEPAYPGAYDFQRQSYFASIGAVGFTISPFQVVGKNQGFFPRLKEISAGVRARIADFVLANAPPRNAGFIIAIMTGDRSAMAEEQLEDMRASGLAHLLAISGLHMGMIGGLVFFAVRFVLVLSNRLALYYPVKKIAAISALFALLGYLFVSGMSASAMRAFIMASAVLLAICFDRRALSLRMVALAAILILLLYPESLISASFQMSFAAVFALISLYEFAGQPLGRYARRGGYARRALVYIVGVGLTTLVAGLATAPFAIYHFGQVAVYSILANLMAVPLMGIWVMPAVILAFIGYPIGIAFPLDIVGYGIDLILAIAHETTSWPDSVLYLGSFSTLRLVVITLLGLWFIIWRRWPRWLALPLLLLLLIVPTVRPPDILVSASGNLYAIRSQSGGVYFSSSTVETFEAERWQLVMGKGVAEPEDMPIHCDFYGCILVRSDDIIAFSETVQGVEEDCRRANIVISRVPAPDPCREAQLVIDKFDLWRSGAHSLAFGKKGEVIIKTANGLRGKRPWVPLRYQGLESRDRSENDG